MFLYMKKKIKLPWISDSEWDYSKWVRGGMNHHLYKYTEKKDITRGNNVRSLLTCTLSSVPTGSNTKLL